jgi:crotonobetainyl-CoA:carnitine CoA-transferase CaiB-like acyl-CoA transferase
LEVQVLEQVENDTMLGAYRILDLTDDKGLYCSQLLGNLGADVIKVEKPGGDPARNIGPFFHDIPDPEKSLFWLAFNTNKRGITLNIETNDGKEIFKKLVKTADVVVESFNPEFMAIKGLGYPDLEKINPVVIMTSITPFGQTGPYKDYWASDLSCWAMGGLLAITGDPEKPPVRIGSIPFAYLMGSMDGAWATAIALCYRERATEGQHVDVSIQESMAKTAWMMHELWEVTGENYHRGSSHYKWPNSEVTLRLVWPVKDGYITFMPAFVSARAPQMSLLVQWIDSNGMADDYLRGIDWTTIDFRFMSQEDGERIQGYFARFFQTKTKIELLEGGRQREILLQPIYTPGDILEHPQLKARDYWQEIEYDELNITVSLPGRFCLPSGTMCKIWRRAPAIGEHNWEIYHEELGFSTREMVNLKQAGII